MLQSGFSTICKESQVPGRREKRELGCRWREMRSWQWTENTTSGVQIQLVKFGLEMALSTWYESPNRMEENKSPLNPQVQQLQVSQPLAQLLFQFIGFPSASVLPPSFCTSLRPAGGSCFCLDLSSSIQNICVSYQGKPSSHLLSLRVSRIPASYISGWVWRSGASSQSFSSMKG